MSSFSEFMLVTHSGLRKNDDHHTATLLSDFCKSTFMSGIWNLSVNGGYLIMALRREKYKIKTLKFKLNCQAFVYLVCIQTSIINGAAYSKK